MLTVKSAAYCPWTICCTLEAVWGEGIGGILRRRGGAGGRGWIGPGGGFREGMIVSYAPTGAGRCGDWRIPTIESWVSQLYPYGVCNFLGMITHDCIVGS